MANKLKVSVVGASGYTGAELLRLLLQHPNVEIVGIAAQKTAGQKIAAVIPTLRAALDMTIEAVDVEKLSKNSDAVFCALPHGASAGIVNDLRARNVVVIDLSADYRLRNVDTYNEWYGAHPHPERVSEAVYGLVELSRVLLRKADLIAVPGCYPTASALALLPLLDAGAIESAGIVIDAKSGVSGAGRQSTQDTHFSEISEGIRAYKAAAHRHGVEIEQSLSAAAKRAVTVTFVPHLVPMNRGILATAYATPIDKGLSAQTCSEIARKYYQKSPFVDVADETTHPDTLWVRASNRALISYRVDAHNNKVIAMCVIDNLVKGAAGQALQCFNVRFGLEEGAGLNALPVWP